MPIIPGRDPNEAYDIGHMPAREHDLPPDHCAPDRHDLAERYASDPDYRLSLVTKFIHDR